MYCHHLFIPFSINLHRVYFPCFCVESFRSGGVFTLVQSTSVTLTPKLNALPLKLCLTLQRTMCKHLSSRHSRAVSNVTEWTFTALCWYLMPLLVPHCLSGLNEWKEMALLLEDVATGFAPSKYHVEIWSWSNMLLQTSDYFPTTCLTTFRRWWLTPSISYPCSTCRWVV